MLGELSDQDRFERDAIIADIRAAFAGVTRGDRGISWYECVAIDNYESEDVCAAARLSDTDSQWSELVDKSEWQPFPGIGGFCFINAEGFRYYLPPTMIRFLLGDNSEWYPGHFLESINRFTGNQSSFWTRSQLRCIARFIAFIGRHDTEVLVNPDDRNPWAEAIKAGWGTHLPESKS
jgi:hypothetical protein